jgi:DNA polymerase-3 subunit gamma/tau
MSHVSFYRKWRPQAFEEIIGQDRVTRTLQNAIRTNRVVHAYLFAGHRGTGKTTTARILAKALNCVTGPTATPDGSCPNCQAIAGGYSVDVIEIDAATNRGIDEIRELRDRIRLTPTEGRYKVYIIDEAHMLTTEGANALLKTLEEPPAHAVLVLVTTEPHRLPPTILSRCQRFDFRRVSQKEIIARLRHIAETEGFRVEEPALALIADAADGSVRDAESILDQLASFAEGPITGDDVVSVLGILAEDIALRLADAILRRDVPACVDLVDHVISEGKDVRQVLRTLLDHFRDLLVLQSGARTDVLDTTEQRLAALRAQAERAAVGDVLQALKVLAATEAEARWSPQPRLLLEIGLIRLCRPEMDATLEGLRARLAGLEQRLGGDAGGGAAASPQPAEPRPVQDRPPAPAQPTPPAPAPAPSRPQPRPGTRPPSKGPMNATTPPAVMAVVETPVDLEHRPPLQTAPHVALEDVRRSWARILEEVKHSKMFCHALLIEGIPLQVDAGTLVIGLRTGYNFHAENLHRPENRSIVEGAIERVLQQRLRLQCTILDGDTGYQASGPSVSAATDPVIAKAMELFGAEVVEIKES